MHQIGKERNLLEKTEVELNNFLAARTIQDAKFRLDQTPADNLLYEPQVFKHGQRSRMGRGGTRIIVDTRFRLEHLNGEVLPGKSQRRNNPDRTTAGDDDRLDRLQ